MELTDAHWQILACLRDFHQGVRRLTRQSGSGQLREGAYWR